MIPDLHTHLYGSLDLDDLEYLVSRNRHRTEIFRASFRKLYAADPPANLFDLSDEGKRLRESFYYCVKPADFQRFQLSFDLVISVSSTLPDELAEIVSRVCRKNDHYAEYRMMFSPATPSSLFKEKVHALCEAFSRENQMRRHPAKLVISVSREDETGTREYRDIRSLQQEFDCVRNELVAIDFCGTEEGFPPNEKLKFITTVLEENETVPDRALAVLYHVGESYGDKSVESAIRWIVESAHAGVHRIGHAVALGIDPQLFRDTERTEPATERLDQLRFEMAHIEELIHFGYPITKTALEAEIDSVARMAPDALCSFRYDEKKIEAVRAFQNWGIARLKRTQCVIESCPTSNLMITGIPTMQSHPLFRFHAEGLPVVIGTDDPGIFRTSIDEEFEKLRKAGLTQSAIEEIIETARRSDSKTLSSNTTRQSAASTALPVTETG